VWDAETGKPLLNLAGHTGYVWSVGFSPDGSQIVTGSADQTAKLWSARTGTQPLELKGHTSPVSSVAFSPDGTRLVTGSGDLTAKVWDARTDMPLLELTGHTKGVLSVAFSPDGTRIVTGSWDRTAKVWDARTSQPLLDLKGHTGEVWGVGFSPDGTHIVTRTGELNKPAEAKVWDAQSGAELKGEPIPATVANNWTSPDGRLFAHPEGNRVELISLEPDEEELSYRLLHTRPDPERYREDYETARADRDDFAAGFYLNLLADRKLAAGRTPDALDRLAALSAASPQGTELALTVAALQAWFGREKDLAATRRRILALAGGHQRRAARRLRSRGVQYPPVLRQGGTRSGAGPRSHGGEDRSGWGGEPAGPRHGGVPRRQRRGRRGDPARRREGRSEQPQRDGRCGILPGDEPVSAGKARRGPQARDRGRGEDEAFAQG
jgi:hypothetical protein